VPSSQRRVEELVDILTQPVRIQTRKPTPPLQQNLGLQPRSTRWTEFSDRVAGSRDGEVFAGRDTVDHLPAVVAELADADLGCTHG